MTARWIYPETAQPTRRLVTALLWLFAVVVAYPYLPGSQTEAFKGISVFLGLMVTLGSSGLVNQIMSGFTITYSRALRLGDFVRDRGRRRHRDASGRPVHEAAGRSATKTSRSPTPSSSRRRRRTSRDIGDTTACSRRRRSRLATTRRGGRCTRCCCEAAERTAGLRREPKPVVLQAGLEDFYVKYTLFVCLERQESRPFVAGRAAREHPGRVQRVRRADHVAELRPRSRGAEGGAEEGLVRRARRRRAPSPKS